MSFLCGFLVHRDGTLCDDSSLTKKFINDYASPASVVRHAIQLFDELAHHPLPDKDKTEEDAWVEYEQKNGLDQ